MYTHLMAYICNSADALLCCTSAQADTFCMSAGVYVGFSRGMYIFFSHVSSAACMNTRLQAHGHMHVFLWNTLASMKALGKCSVRHYVDRCRCNASSNLQKPIQTSSFHAQSQNWSAKIQHWHNIQYFNCYHLTLWSMLVQGSFLFINISAHCVTQLERVLI